MNWLENVEDRLAEPEQRHPWRDVLYAVIGGIAIYVMMWLVIVIDWAIRG